MPLLVGGATPLTVLRTSHHDLVCCDCASHFDASVEGTWKHISPCSCAHDDKYSSERGHPTNSKTETDVSIISDDAEDSEPNPSCHQHKRLFHNALPPQEQQDEGNHGIFPFADRKLSPHICQKSVQFIKDEIDFTDSETSSTTSSIVCDDDLVHLDKAPVSSFLLFRINYSIVMVAIMLADGLQGTHLYILYEGYGYSVASLYCLGFVTGAVTSPITGALVDKIGRKKAALLYCALEILINMLEQYSILAGLIISRMIGGITTNLLSSVFETWLDCEYRRRGFEKKKYEIIMRDSVVASNLAAIASGFIAHRLAERFGPVGPFEGAVACTAVAFVVVMSVWTENYGSQEPGLRSVSNYLTEAIETFKSDSKVLRVSIIQGLTMGSLQIFVFLWSPALREMARNSAEGVLGLDSHGEPAYGLIFGGFMAAGVIGGSIAPSVRKAVTLLISPLAKSGCETVTIEGEGEVRPMAVEFLAACCYLICSCLLLSPCLVSCHGMFSFSTVLVAFLLYELMIGIYMPCEGVIRSLYIPSNARCSMMTFPRIIVNVAVSLGVISTRFVTLNAAFFAVSCLMTISAVLQLSLVSAREWDSLNRRVDRWKKKAVRSLSFHAGVDTLDKKSKARPRAKSMPSNMLQSSIWELETTLGDGKKND